MALIIGFIFGFCGSVPVAGPISILVLSRGLENRFRHGLYIAAGGAVAEAAYACLAFLGFSSFLSKHAWLTPASRVFAAVVLIILGTYLVFRKQIVPPPQADPKLPKNRKGNKRSFLLGFSITAMNPTLIGTWTAAITTLFSMDILSFKSIEALPFSLGVLAGIVAWFSILLWLAAHYHKRFSVRALQRLVKGMGIFVLLLGIGFGVRAIQYFASLS
jgi:threonine/homoserine/homoserine lactone efflux protein